MGKGVEMDKETVFPANVQFETLMAALHAHAPKAVRTVTESALA